MPSASSAAARPTPWWNNASASSRALPPSAVLFFHIEKTGGGSVVHHLMRKNPWFSLKLEYFRARKFAALHEDLFPKEKMAAAAAWRARTDGSMPDWRNTTVAVEFHRREAQTFFWKHIVPALPALRQRYASVGGRLVTLTTMREPMPMILSWFRQWPPRLPDRSVSPLVPWLPNASGLLTRSLVFDELPAKWKTWHTTRVPYFPCPAALAEAAQRRLQATFDLVGDVSNVTWTLRTLVSDCLGWPSAAQPRASELVHVRYGGGLQAFTARETGAVFGAGSEVSGGTASTAAGCDGEAVGASCALAAAARCDRPLYESVRGGMSRCAHTTRRAKNIAYR